MNYGILSIVPIVITLFIAFKFKNVFIALLSGIFTASLILGIKTADFFVGFNSIASVFTSVSTAKTTFFILLVGAIMNISSLSGGVEGVIVFFTEKQKIVKTQVGAQLISFILGLLLFVDGTSSIVVTALVGKPFFKKYNVPKEKLALISNSTGSAIAWIVPFGGACAFLTGVLSSTFEGMGYDGNAFSTVVKSVGFQFYSIALIVIVFLSIVTKFELGGIKKSINNNVVKETTHIYETDLPTGKMPLARNMIVPIVTMLIIIFTILFVTGEGDILKGDGATAVFTSGVLTLILSGIYYLIQRITTLDKYLKWCFDGMKNLFEIMLILVLAFAFSALLSSLGTAGFIAGFTDYMPSSIMLLASFVFAVLISYSTGSSGASVVLLVPIIIPIIYSAGISMPIVLGAIVSGSVFGDQNSPISDSVILTSTTTGVDIMSHVKTQIPYTAIALAVAFVAYLVLGFFA